MIVQLPTQPFYERQGRRIDEALQQVSVASKQLSNAVDVLLEAMRADTSQKK